MLSGLLSREGSWNPSPGPGLSICTQTGSGVWVPPPTQFQMWPHNEIKWEDPTLKDPRLPVWGKAKARDFQKLSRPP